MSWEKGNGGDSDDSGGISGFLRSLLAGVPWSEGARGDEVLHLPLPKGNVLRVHNANGRTRIIGEDRDDIEVTAEKVARAECSAAAEELIRQIQVVANHVGDFLDLEIEIPKKWNRHGSADLEIKLPRDIRVAVSAANGRVCLEGMRNGVKAESSNGSISMVDIVGDIAIFTSNAKVCCKGTCGRLVARSSNGKVELGDHSGSVDASTSNGIIRVSLKELGADGAILTTSNGRIVLELPAQVDAEVDIRVENGIIRTERELDAQSGQSIGRARGKLGRGGALIKLRTSNGTVSLR